MEIYDDTESVLVVYVGSLGDEYTLDLSCIFYICPDRSWFDTYKVVNDTVLLWNNKRPFVVGVGAIQTRM